MNINSIITKDYRKKDDFVVRINKPNLVRRRRIAKMNVNLFVTKNYENKTAFRLQKNKPNQTQFQRQKMLLHLTINGRRASFGYYADEIEAAKAYDRLFLLASQSEFGKTCFCWRY